MLRGTLFSLRNCESPSGLIANCLAGTLNETKLNPSRAISRSNLFADAMSTNALLRKCHDLAGLGPETSLEPDSLVGFFQVFRPDGQALAELFSELEVGDELQSRLQQLYAIAGDDRRPSGGRDAYFLVRDPKPLEPERAEQLATSWLEGLIAIASHLEEESIRETLQPLPRIRVLEGTPPKHPKDEAEKSRLLRSVQQAATLVERIDAGPFPAALRPAYYFSACDTMLRDYLMWPLYARATGLRDPLFPYFELWRHGVKYRIFGETQVDLYLPRHLE